MMKKLLYMLLAVLLVSSVSVAAKATQEQPEAAGYTVTVVSDAADLDTVPVGERITVKVMLSSSDTSVTGYNAFDLTLQYNAQKLVYVAGSCAQPNGTVTAADGNARIKGYGDEQPFSVPAATLVFETKALGNAQVELTSALVSHEEDALNDADDGEVLVDTAQVQADGYKVVVQEDVVETSQSVVDGTDKVTFILKDSDIYDYEVKITVGGEDITNKVSYNSTTGIYTIPQRQIDGKIEITTLEKTPKTFTVTITGSYITGEKTAQYGEDYPFTLDRDSGYQYTVTVTIDGEEFEEYEVSGDEYIIPGEHITGNIKLKATRTKETTSSTTSSSNKTTSTKTDSTANKVTVSFTGSGAADAEGEKTATKSTAYTFRIKEADGYTYAVSAQVNGKKVTCTYNETKKIYTIAAADVKGNIEISVEKTSGLEITEYLTLDGRLFYRIIFRSAVEAGSVPKYDAESMYWSEAENAYVWLVESSLEKEAFEVMALDKIAVAKGTAAGTLENPYDINRDERVDTEDAKFAWQLYGGRYPAESVDVKKLLLADVNRDGTVNVQDAAAIVHHIVQQREEAQKDE